MKNGIVTLAVLSLLSFTLAAQPNKTYFSMEDALSNPEQVYKLSLRGLTELPPEVLQFRNLKSLSVGGLTEFPKQILQLTNLEELNLYYHEITSFPDGISQLQNLKVLNLQGKSQQTSFPATIFSLVNLEELNLSQNGLITIPELSKLSKLRELNLGYNEFEQLPDVFGSLRSLQELTLAGNKLTSLPPSIGKLQQLTLLDLKYNQFKTIPTVVFECTNLQKLEVTRNGLTTISPEIGELRALSVLDLSHNELTDLPASFATLKQLEELDVTLNPFDKVFPDAVYGLTSLKRLTYQRFKLKYEDDYQARPLGDGFCKLTSLEELTINATEITSLPTCFGNLKQLKRLTLTLSPTSHAFPREIAQLTNLERLKYVSRGYPIREFPAGMSNLTQLKSLELGKEQLTEAQKEQLQRDLPGCRIKYGR